MRNVAFYPAALGDPFLCIRCMRLIFRFAFVSAAIGRSCIRFGFTLPFALARESGRLFLLHSLSQLLLHSLFADLLPVACALPLSVAFARPDSLGCIHSTIGGGILHSFLIRDAFSFFCIRLRLPVICIRVLLVMKLAFAGSCIHSPRLAGCIHSADSTSPLLPRPRKTTGRCGRLPRRRRLCSRTRRSGRGPLRRTTLARPAFERCCSDR